MTIKKKKIKTTLWYISKPRYWVQYYQLVKRKILGTRDRNYEKDKAISWAKKHAVDYINSWKELKGEIINFDNKILIEANQLASNYQRTNGWTWSHRFYL